MLSEQNWDHKFLAIVTEKLSGSRSKVNSMECFQNHLKLKRILSIALYGELQFGEVI